MQMNQETPEDRFNKLVDQLVIENGWSKRKARRYLEAYAKKENERLIKEGKARQEKLKAEGKLIDVSEEREQLEFDFQTELAKQNYQASTNEF